MFYKTAFLVLLLCTFAHASNVPQAANTVGMGGNSNLDGGLAGVKGLQCNIPFTTHTATVCFSTGTGGATANNYLSGVVQGPQGANSIGQGTSGSFYQVSSGKVAFMCGYYSLSGVAANTHTVSFGYSTTVPASLNTATVPTGPVYFSGAANLYQTFNTGSASQRVYVPYKKQYPASSFPWIQTGTAGQIYEYCADIYEVTASP